MDKDQFNVITKKEKTKQNLEHRQRLVTLREVKPSWQTVGRQRVVTRHPRYPQHPPPLAITTVRINPQL